jgi:hypothetical protein
VDNFIICKSFGLGCSQDYWLDVFAKTSSSLKCFCGPFPQWFIAFGSSCLHQSIMNGLEILILRCLWKKFTNGIGIPCISFPNNLLILVKFCQQTFIMLFFFSFVKTKFEIFFKKLFTFHLMIWWKAKRVTISIPLSPHYFSYFNNYGWLNVKGPTLVNI